LPATPGWRFRQTLSILALAAGLERPFTNAEGMSMLRWILSVVFAVLPLLAVDAATDAGGALPGPLLGYDAAASQQQLSLEHEFREGLNGTNIRENLRRLSARPHHVGSPYGKDNAQWMLAKFKEWGFDARIERFDVLFPTPKQRLLEMTQPSVFRAGLTEAALPGDPTSGQADEQLPTYNAYSIDGDVTAPLVYVNYGDREDYEQLDRLGISVKGAIVIARYGSGWRGVKPKVAAEHGAIGCIIYSDPSGDGYARGDEYPKGGWRPGDGVQRGSVMDTDYPGDPLTPGVGATPKAKRLALRDARTITKIPVLPISWRDALPLLSALDGPVAPAAWRGALPITYHLGAGPAVVHLKVSSNWDLKPVYDVIATLKGAVDDQWVIRGNHHDAWVNGADDPLAGMAPMLEEARMLGQLHAGGWVPARTIVYCAWDGEEPGLLGSVEWVETHLAELKTHAALYINSDGNDRGFFYPGGTQDLQSFISGVARDIQDPETRTSIYQRAHLAAIAHAKDAEERADLRHRSDLLVEALGDGSDYTAFQDHAGIPTLDLSFGGEDDGDQYHSIYDDFAWYTRFVDPDQAYGRALAAAAGTAVLRAVGAALLPFDYAPQAEAVGKYAGELEKLLKDKQEEYTERALQLKEGVFDATRDPRRPLAAPTAEAVPPYMNFAPLKNAVNGLKTSAQRYGDALNGYRARPAAPSAGALAPVNADLLRVARLFLNEKGLPERPWFKNQVYAPGAYTGYGAKPMAAVREYMDQRKWREADAQIPAVAQAIEAVAAGIDKAADDLTAALRPP
jgi:N-acetylated-alpha-linked acidic dipeptidase